MKKYRRLPAALVVACLALGMVAAPSAVAAGKSDKAQSAQKRVTTKSLNKKLNSTRKSLSSLSKSLGRVSARLKTGENSIALLLGAAPQLVTGLQTLANATQTQIVPGLQQLKSVLETQVAPGLKALETGLNQVATSQEYGVTNILIQQAGVFLPLGVTSGDIPDDGNTTSASGTVPVTTGNGTGGTVPVGTTLVLRSAIRSGETDGEETGDPAGYVGGLLTMTCAGGSGPQGTCDLDGGDATSGVVPVGQLVCAIGPSASTQIPLPTGSNLNAFVQKIQEAADRTDQSVPSAALDAATVNPLDGASANPTPLQNTTLDGCNVGTGLGNTFMLNVQTQFLDAPTSLKPKPTD